MFYFICWTFKPHISSMRLQLYAVCLGFYLRPLHSAPLRLHLMSHDMRILGYVQKVASYPSTDTTIYFVREVKFKYVRASKSVRGLIIRNNELGINKVWFKGIKGFENQIENLAVYKVLKLRVQYWILRVLIWYVSKIETFCSNNLYLASKEIVSSRIWALRTYV